MVCDMTTAPDTPTERVADYERLFTSALIGRERTDRSIRFRFRLEDGVEARVRDLADREKACCPFFTFTVTTHDDEIRWDASVVDDAIARQILEEFYLLPETVADGAQALHARMVDKGLDIVIDDGGTDRSVTADESGLSMPGPRS